MRRRLSAAAAAAVLALVGGCSETSSIGGVGDNGDSEGTGGHTSSGSSGSGGGGAAAPARKADKVDILFTIDNSSSMADKQQVMALALADMISSFTNPPCMTAAGGTVAALPSGACPAASVRVFAPIDDIHVGVVTTSLGGLGGPDGQFCQDSSPGHQNDHAHLIDRGPNRTTVPTYQSRGYLAWDPNAHYTPQGDSDIGVFTDKVKNLVLGAGQDGCGLEQGLESWYRFLVEPEPYKEIVRVGPANFEPSGIDQTILTQRAQFLRPDSLLVVVMLSDEDDCSIVPHGSAPLIASPDPLPRARAICATDPGDPCCASCAASAPAGCGADPTCADNGGMLMVDQDPADLRCFNQKGRFGFSGLLPKDRYIQGLTSTVVSNPAGDLVPNPLYSILNSEDAAKPLRDPGLVVLAGIVGAPWQDLARDPHDATQGLKSGAELSQVVADGKTGWQIIVGDPDSFVAPADPFMRESIAARSGANPITGDAIEPVGSSTNNSVNGHEYDTHGSDLQYACTFPLATPRDCSATRGGCDCMDPAYAQSSLCDGTTQIAAKAYPGLRQLDLIQSLGDQGVASSICPSNTTDTSAADYGYRSAVRAVVERVGARVQR